MRIVEDVEEYLNLTYKKRQYIYTIPLGPEEMMENSALQRLHDVAHRED